MQQRRCGGTVDDSVDSARAAELRIGSKRPEHQTFIELLAHCL